MGEEGSLAREEWKNDLRHDLAVHLNIDKRRIVIEYVRPGSVTVGLVILDLAGQEYSDQKVYGTAVSAEKLVESLKEQLSTGRPLEISEKFTAERLVSLSPPLPPPPPSTPPPPLLEQILENFDPLLAMAIGAGTVFCCFCCSICLFIRYRERRADRRARERHEQRRRKSGLEKMIVQMAMVGGHGRHSRDSRDSNAGEDDDGRSSRVERVKRMMLSLGTMRQLGQKQKKQRRMFSLTKKNSKTDAVAKHKTMGTMGKLLGFIEQEDSQAKAKRRERKQKKLQEVEQEKFLREARGEPEPAPTRKRVAFLSFKSTKNFRDSCASKLEAREEAPESAKQAARRRASIDAPPSQRGATPSYKPAVRPLNTRVAVYGGDETRRSNEGASPLSDRAQLNDLLNDGDLTLREKMEVRRNERMVRLRQSQPASSQLAPAKLPAPQTRTSAEVSPRLQEPTEAHVPSAEISPLVQASHPQSDPVPASPRRSQSVEPPRPSSTLVDIGDEEIVA